MRTASVASRVYLRSKLAGKYSPGLRPDTPSPAVGGGGAAWEQKPSHASHSCPCLAVKPVQRLEDRILVWQSG